MVEKIDDGMAKWLEEKIKERRKAAEPHPAAEEESTGPPLPGPPRGGLMDAIKGTSIRDTKSHFLAIQLRLIFSL